MSSVFDSIKTWPFEEARSLLKRVENKSMVTFETGYGPSGLPHIGTFGEVVRTTMVRHAFSELSDIPTRLLCFSDDLDGLRKVPDNIPNGEAMQPFLNFPLTAVPDPFGKYASFGEHNNARLRAFIDDLGLEYTFMSSTECYKSGMFDQQLLNVLRHHKEILAVILPTLGPERRQTYSPFLPISPSTGRVLQVPIEEYRDTTVVFRDEDGALVEQPVTGGSCKLQWKVDWGMRWVALGVDYEMCGKDLIDSVTLANKVCRILGGNPPQNLTYEHFLDEAGGKISKSKGNGLSVEEWLRFAPMESLSYYMYQTPRRAKRLFFDVIPKHVDDYLNHLGAFSGQSEEQKMKNPVWSIHSGNPPVVTMPPVTFALLLNLVSVCQGQDKGLVWAFIQRAYPDVHPETHPLLDQLVGHAVVYYQEKVVCEKQYRLANEQESKAFRAFVEALKNTPETDAFALQTIAYSIGNAFFPLVKDWFDAFYQVLFGQQSGPRVGSFVALYGKEDTCVLIESRLNAKGGGGVLDPSAIYPMEGVTRLCFLKNIIKNPNIIVGDYTYYDDPEDVYHFERNVLYHIDAIGDRLIIGKFCQIATGVTFIMNGANHGMSGFSTYPFKIMGGPWASARMLSDLRGDTVVGNDVWIGYDVTILSGIHIGDGAIIGAKSMVTRDVAPYTVVAGNPALEIRTRFNPETVAVLMQLRWWDWDVEKIGQHLDVLLGGDCTALRNVLLETRGSE